MRETLGGVSRGWNSLGEGGLENGDFGIFFGYQELDGHSRDIESDFFFFF